MHYVVVSGSLMRLCLCLDLYACLDMVMLDQQLSIQKVSSLHVSDIIEKGKGC